MRVLVGEISSYKAIVLARYFKQNYKDIYVYTYGKENFSNKIRTKYSDHFFYIDAFHFESELEAIIVEYEIDFFFPVINNSLTLLLNQKGKFGKSLDYLGDIETYNILNNKASLHTLAKSLKIRVPNTYESIEKASLPCVFKPTNLSSAMGVRYICKESDKSKISIKNKENYIIQDYIEGTGVGYSFYCKNGVINNGYGHKRLAEFPVSGGSSTYRKSYRHARMHDIASAIVEELNYTGFAMFEFKLTPDNILYLIEVNPRIWGSINQGLADGSINYFEDILGISTAKKFLKPRKINTYIPLVFFSIFSNILRFRFKLLFVFIANSFRNKPDVGLFGDPKGYFSTILRKLW